jgi:hypothetical protein
MTEMRKSIARSEDFLSGIVKKVEKMKPINGMPKGVHTIQMFDAKSGELVKEIHSENFIGIAWDEIQKAIAKFAFTTQYFRLNDNYGLKLENYNVDGADTSANGLLAKYNQYDKLFGHRLNMDIPFYTPFRFMLLTDDTSPESPLTERLWKGKYIGYTRRETTYSGADTKYGSFNSAESMSENKHVKFVWDFPTHAGNGTINSLVWSDELFNGPAVLPTDEFILTAPDGFNFNLGEAGYSRIYGNSLYVGLNTITGEHWGIGKWTIDFTTMTATYVSVVTLNNPWNSTSYDLQSFAIDARNGDIYAFSAEGRLSRYTSAGGARIAFKHGVMLDITIENGSNDYQMAIEIKDGIIYYNTQWYQGKIEARVLDTWVAYQPTFVYSTSNGTAITTIDFIDGFGVAMGNMENKILFYDNLVNGFAKTSLAPADVIGLPNMYNTGVMNVYRGVDGDLAYLYGAVSNSTTLRVVSTKLGRMGGRNLLPTPITKTSDYTMKVTYDLYFE